MSLFELCCTFKNWIKSFVFIWKTCIVFFVFKIKLFLESWWLRNVSWILILHSFERSVSEKVLWDLHTLLLILIEDWAVTCIVFVSWSAWSYSTKRGITLLRILMIARNVTQTNSGFIHCFVKLTIKKTLFTFIACAFLYVCIHISPSQLTITTCVNNLLELNWFLMLKNFNPVFFIVNIALVSFSLHTLVLHLWN